MGYYDGDYSLTTVQIPTDDGTPATFRLTVNVSARRRARKGAEFMDRRAGGIEWVDSIDETRLDMGSASACVFGQYYGDFRNGRIAAGLTDTQAQLLGFDRLELHSRDYIVDVAGFTRRQYDSYERAVNKQRGLGSYEDQFKPLQEGWLHEILTRKATLREQRAKAEAVTACGGNPTARYV